jgi:hypothetical protein
VLCSGCATDSAPTPEGCCAHCGRPYPQGQPTEPFGLTYERLDLTRQSAIERFRTKWDVFPADRWCRRRWAYRLSLVGLFVLIAFYIGPTRIIFGRWTRLAPADFVPVVRDQCVPIVRAIKVYQRDHGGRLPQSVEQALPPTPKGDYHYVGNIWQNEFRFRSKWNHEVRYDFTPGREGWSVSGAFTHGPISFPPVAPPTTTQP